MARSMTAYGRSHAKTASGLFLIEIHSVNRKSLDIKINLPKELLILDMDLRKALGKVVQRGSLFVRITKESGKGSLVEPPSLDMLKTVHQEWSKCAEELGYDAKEAIPFSMLMQWSHETNASADVCHETLKKELLQGFDEALKAFVQMKEKEGATLVADIIPRLKTIERDVDKVRKLAKRAPERYQERLETKLQELKTNHVNDEERLLKEVVLFAEKIDITEEITRLSSHLQQFEKILQNGNRVGRELDFLTQEMHREVNTIAAKSQELEITQAVLAMKSELEKNREQLANIE